jgi:4a-hydroxytetrahydrobiopterin dehydratase
MTQDKCEDCYSGAEVLSGDVLHAEMQAIPSWEYCQEKKCLLKKYSFKGYYKTIAFVNAIAWIAQQQQHHPDLEVSYNCVVVRYQTHAVGGVTKSDIICAGLVDGLSAA